MKKNNRIWIFITILAGFLSVLPFSCKKSTPIKVTPVVTIAAVTNITATSASCGGEVTSDGGAVVTARGVCWGIGQNPTTVNDKSSNEKGMGSFTSSISGLTPGTSYNIRAYAVNEAGTSYSSQSTFTTITTVPILTTVAVTAVGSNSASSGGNITSDGGSPITARGVCWSKGANPSISNTHSSDGTGNGDYSSSIIGLSPGITYYIRAYATNSLGTAYGNQVSATTLPTLPEVSTGVLSAITTTSAACSGNVTSDGGAPVLAKGICWNTSQNSTINNFKTTEGTGTGTFTSNITGLTANTTYYVRAYAINSVGTAYGNELTLTTAPLTINDIEGNVYHTVSIGTQVWLVENLKTTVFNDGTSIPNVTDNKGWTNLTSSAYCWYNNDIAGKNTYGALYNWYTVNTGKLCISGWHVPTDAEWTILTTFLGGTNTAGGKLKETGTIHWISPNTSATNETGFTALPGGARDATGPYFGMGYSCFLWSASEMNVSNVWYRSMRNSNSDVVRDSNYRIFGYYVRCLRN
jgi:uncharacterized protein (TIGR02145 family)